MNITISDPSPAPEMPVMWAVASPCGNTQCNWSLMSWGHLEKSAREDHARTPGSRLIKIDPNAPSFEAGPTEWVDSKGYVCRVSTEYDALMIHDGFGVADFPATIADIDHLIRALLAAREQVARDAARKGKG